MANSLLPHARANGSQTSPQSPNGGKQGCPDQGSKEALRLTRAPLGNGLGSDWGGPNFIFPERRFFVSEHSWNSGVESIDCLSVTSACITASLQRHPAMTNDPAHATEKRSSAMADSHCLAYNGNIFQTGLAIQKSCSATQDSMTPILRNAPIDWRHW